MAIDGNLAASPTDVNFAAMGDGSAKSPERRPRWLPKAGAVITASALLLQWVLFLRRGPELGLGAIASTAKFLTFMTNLTAMGVLIVFTAAVVGDRSPWARWASDPIVQGAMLVYALLVGLVYHFLLSGYWHPDTAWWTAALLLHYVMPGIYLLHWSLSVPGGRTRWVHVLWWQAFPIGYVTLIMLIGPGLAGYPYPFLDPDVLGWPSVLRTMIMVLLGYMGLSALVVALDHWRGGSSGLRARTG